MSESFVENRILQLSRVKVQLLISWMSYQELAALIRSGEQDLEDYIMDNISRDGRMVLLETLGMESSDYEKRSKIVRKVNNRYLELLEETGHALTSEERKAVLKSAVDELDNTEWELYQSQRRFPEKAVSETIRMKIEEYLHKLDRGYGLSNNRL